MLSMNIYTSGEKIEHLETISPEIREVTSRELSCKDKLLNPNEINLSLIVSNNPLPIADTEIEVFLDYPLRIVEDARISSSLRDYVQENCPKAGSVYVCLRFFNK